VVLASAVAVALGASGVYIANASAGETATPGQLQAEAFSARTSAGWPTATGSNTGA
jgi:hypothetical protein